MKLDKWTQQLHDKLADHEAAAPDDLWADIEAALPSSGGHFPVLRQHNARFVALRRWAVAASVAALLGSGGMFWWWENRQSESMVSMAEVSQRDDLQSSNLQVAETQPVDSHGEATPRQFPTPQRGGVAAGRGCNSNSTIAQAIIPEQTDKIQTPPPTPPLEGRGVAAHEDTPDIQSGTEDTRITQPLLDKPSVSRPRRSSRRLTLGLYAMNGFGSQDRTNAVQMADALAQNYANTYAAGQAGSRQAPIFLTGYEERQHHHQPVAYGITLSYPLTPRLFLTSGMVYTRLKSEFTQTIHSQQISTDQTLHYVGVPLNANYRLWQYGGLNVYLSAGMQADWNVKAQLSTEGVEQEMDRDRLQWSASGSLGLQYNVLPQLSLYAEPGVTHYFNNGSPVQNFIKDKPTSLKLQLGVRLNLK